MFTKANSNTHTSIDMKTRTLKQKSVYFNNITCLYIFTLAAISSTSTYNASGKIEKCEIEFRRCCYHPWTSVLGLITNSIDLSKQKRGHDSCSLCVMYRLWMLKSPLRHPFQCYHTTRYMSQCNYISYLNT